MNVSQKTRRVLIGSAVAVIGVLTSITPVASAHPVASRTTQTQCAISYTVVRGDSWWKISRKAGTSLSAVLKANKAKTSTKLLVGKTVCLPKGAKVGSGSVASRSAQTQCAISYTVVRGDSWWKISRKAGTSVSAVLKANKAKTSTKLLVGKTVCLPAGAKAGTGSGAASKATCGVSYKTVRNDSWSRIAKKKKVSLRELLQVNSATTKTKIFIGDVLCLPKSATSATQTSKRLVLGPPPKIYSAKKSTAIVREVFPKRLHTRALAIVKRESRFNAAAYNWCCVGLFQINWYAHNKWLGEMGITTPEQLLDARVNAKAALALYKRSNGWGPWK